MSLRQQLVIQDGKWRPPALIRKACVHNGPADLSLRSRGDMLFDVDWVLGRQVEQYTCIQCGHTIEAKAMGTLYQAYMLGGQKFPVVSGRNLKAI